MNKLRVGGMTPFTTIDYPGELAAVVFCQGCPWRCRYCQNTGLLEAGAKAQTKWADVSAFLEHRRGLLDAVVFSGGEPTLQSDLNSAVAEARSLGFKVGLHTAGCYPDRLDNLLPDLDWVGLDIKASPEHHRELTGVDRLALQRCRTTSLLDVELNSEVPVITRDYSALFEHFVVR